MQPSKVGRLLASDAGFQPIVEKALEINALSKLCVDFLPPGQARLVRAINFNDRPGDRQLILLAASPAAAAKLKLLSEALRKYLSAQGAEVNSVHVKVQPGSIPAPDAAARQPRLSRNALQALQDLYRKLPDSPARKALKSLLDHQLKP